MQSLPPLWKTLSHLKPFFYMIEGFLLGFFGTIVVSPLVSLAVVAVALVFVCGLCLRLLKIGYKIRH